MSEQSSPAPEYREWSLATVRLFQGVVYHDEDRVWNIVLTSRSQLEAYFARIGLALVIDETEGFAFVRQWTDDERPAGYEELPRLVRRTSIGYGATILAVILRDELRRFEEDDLHNERCVVEAEALFEQWKAFFPPQHDEVKQRREFLSAMNKLEELGFSRKFGDGVESWEIRRILKAKLPATELERLKEQLAGVVASRRSAEGQSDA